MIHTNEIRRFPVLNIWTDEVSFDSALFAVREFLEKDSGLYLILASNPEKNFSIPRDKISYESYENADLLIPDGIGMVYAARLLYGAQIERVPGCEFMEELCRLSQRYGYKVFLYGAKEEVLERAKENLEIKYPGLTVVGACHGYIPDDKMPELVAGINESRAQILFLGLGSPRQEKWISKYKDQLEFVRVCQGVGGSFDVIAGNVRRAPKMFRKLGLEWLYRLLSDPGRIKRQSVLPVFAYQILKAKVRGYYE